MKKQHILNAFREQIAELEHEQWMAWARSIAKKEKISSETLLRWGDYLIPYKDLPEDVKEHDRKWADKVLNILLTALTEFEREMEKKFYIAFKENWEEKELKRVMKRFKELQKDLHPSK